VGPLWQPNPGASDQDLDRLRSLAPVQLPASFYEFMSKSNGGRGPLPVEPCYAALYTIDQVISDMTDDSPIHEFFPTFILIGVDEAGDWIALDTYGDPPYRVVWSDLIAPREEALPIAPDFDAFADLLGHGDDPYADD
jgi:hypothetical protein